MMTMEEIKIKANETKEDVKTKAKTWWDEHGFAVKAALVGFGTLLGSAGLGYMKGRQMTKDDIRLAGAQMKQTTVIYPEDGYVLKLHSVPVEELGEDGDYGFFESKDDN